MTRQLCAFRLATVFSLTLGLAISSAARAQDVVIGNWESAAAEGWIDWNTGTLQDIMAPRFAFNSIGATEGTGALQFNHVVTNNQIDGYTQWAAIKLQFPGNNVDEWTDDFMANTKVAMDLTLVASEMAPDAGNDFATVGLTINAIGYGFTSQPAPQTANNNFNPSLLAGTTTRTLIWDISKTHDGDPLTGGGEIDPLAYYIELVFDTYSNGSVVYHIDNVRLFTQGDFDGDLAVNEVDLGILKSGFGQTGQLDDSHGDADENGAVDGNDAIVFQRELHIVPLVATAIPEPGTCMLLTLGAAGFMLRSRRRGN